MYKIEDFLHTKFPLWFRGKEVKKSLYNLLLG